MRWIGLARALFFAAFIAALVLVGRAHAFTFTDAGNGQGWPAAATTITITTTATMHAGDTGIVAISEQGGFTLGTYPTSVIDSAGNSYTRISAASCGQSGANQQLSVWAAVLGSQLNSGGTITVTVGYSAGFLAANAVDITGAAASGEIDQGTCATSNTTSTSVSTSALTPAAANEAAYLIGQSKSTTSQTITSPTVASPPTTSPFGNNIGTQAVGGTATLTGTPSTTGTMTYASNTNGGMLAMVLIKPPAAATVHTLGATGAGN